MMVAQTALGTRRPRLEDGSRIAVVGSGPAGSFFSYFLKDMAERVDLDVAVDLYESRDFSKPAPQGCNMCGGIISETLVQNLATEGINLPPTVVQRGIDSYVLHMDVGSVHIAAPLLEKRIGALHRGPGPRDIKEMKWGSFDGFLQSLAVKKGATLVPERVTGFTYNKGRPRIETRTRSGEYDLLAVAVGVNSPTLKLFGEELAYRPPRTVKTHIREFFLSEGVIDRTLGNSMHVFLLNIPRLEFAAIIPKGDYVSICLLGEDIDKELIDNFLASPEVRKVLPQAGEADAVSCSCSPRISLVPAVKPYADRVVFLGDSGVTRLYKDGIGAAYRTAKAAASTAVFHGISASDFRTHYSPLCRGIGRDNAIGKAAFMVTREIQRHRFARRAVLGMTSREQEGRRLPRMSTVLWDMFTGSATYREIVLRTLHPAFLGRLMWHVIRSTASGGVSGAGETT